MEEIAEPIEITNKVKVAGTTSNEYKLKITKEENLKIFKLIKEQYSKSIYNSITYIVKSRDILEDSFNNLSIKKQIDTLFNMIKILSRSNEDAKFDESLKNGGIKYYRISMNIDNNQIYIVNETTGISL